jgi:hypothetical protein
MTMLLGAFGIGRGNWPAARALGLKFDFGHDVWDIAEPGYERVVGRYGMDDLQPGVHTEAELGEWAKEVRSEGLMPCTSCIPSFLGSVVSTVGEWCGKHSVSLGVQAYHYSPRIYSDIEVLLQRIGTGIRLRHYMGWYGVADSVYPVYSSQAQWKPKKPWEIRFIRWQYRMMRCRLLVFFPWNEQALKALV